MEEINLYDLMRFYAKRWLTILTAVMIGAIIGVIYTFYIQQPQYKSSAKLLLVGTNRTASNQDSVVINNYVELFTSRRVLESVIADQNYDKSYETLASQTTAQNVKSTDFINVSISTSDAKTSKALLEDAIQRFGEESKKLYGDNSIKINVVDAADVPSQPANVQPLRQIGLTSLAGFALAVIGLFFVFDYRNSKGILVDLADDKKSKKKLNNKNSSQTKISKFIHNYIIGDERSLEKK